MLQRVLLPGEPTATEVAFQNLIWNLRTGVSLPDAVTVFCTAVVSNEVQPGH